MSKIMVAVIGCGTIAKASHIPSYVNNPECEVKYFCDNDLQRAQEVVNEYKIGKAISDYREILNDPQLDAVSICTPNNTHKTMSVDFLLAGKHVLCEKPAARTYAEALEMQEACRKSGKILNIGVVNRFSEAVNRIKNMVDAGDLGEVYHVYGSFRMGRMIPGLGGDFTTNKISGGGVLIDWGVHFLDLIMYCIGDPNPTTVSGQAYCKLGKDMKNYTYIDMWAGPPDYSGTYDVDDFVTGLIRTTGPTISINGAWAQNIFEKELYVDFIGDKAGVRLNYGGDFVLYTTKDNALITTTPEFQKPDMFQAEIDDFLNCVRTGEKSQAHIDTVIITSRIMQALYDSSQQGKEITL